MNKSTVKNKFVSLKRKTVGILTVNFILLSIAIYIILDTVLINKIEDLEKKFVTEDLDSVKNDLHSKYDDLEQKTYDWAVWDNTFEFIENKNDEYFKANLNGNCFLNLNINVLLYINKEGKYVYKGAMDLSKQEMVPISQGLIDYIDKIYINKNADSDQNIKGLIMLPEGPMVISSSLILPSDKKGESRGNLIMGYYLNDEIISGVENKLNLSINLDRIDKLNNKQSDLYYSLDFDESFVKPLSKDKIAGYTVLNDINGNSIIGLSIEKNRDIMKIGKYTSKIILTLLIFISFVFTCIILLFLNKNIIQSLIYISKEIKKIGEEKNSQQD